MPVDRIQHPFGVDGSAGFFKLALAGKVCVVIIGGSPEAFFERATLRPFLRNVFPGQTVHQGNATIAFGVGNGVKDDCGGGGDWCRNVSVRIGLGNLYGVSSIKSAQRHGQSIGAFGFDSRLGFGQKASVVVVTNPNAGIGLGEVLKVMYSRRTAPGIRRVFAGIRTDRPWIVEEQVEQGKSPSITAPHIDHLGMKTESVRIKIGKLDGLRKEWGGFAHPPVGSMRGWLVDHAGWADKKDAEEAGK